MEKVYGRVVVVVADPFPADRYWVVTAYVARNFQEEL